MADTINIGNYEVSCFKVGSSDCKIYLGDTLLYPHSTPTVKDYFRLIAKGDGYFTFFSTGAASANTLSYSLDSGTTWNTLVNSGTTPYLDAGDAIMWKGSNLVVSNNGIGKFSASTRFDVEGNVMSLIYGDDFETATTITDVGQFRSLFDSSTNVINASGLTLPATTISQDAYRSMFYGCSGLTTAPALPATTLGESCYKYMFRDCKSLTTAPALPATNLEQSCYANMFQGCTSLTGVPSNYLSATTVKQQCYENMFSGCTSFASLPDLPSTKMEQSCYKGMFYGCTSLTSVPSNYLPATTMETECYWAMFQLCTGITSAVSVLPATTLKQGCYCNMFSRCTSLVTPPVISATTVASACCYNMFYSGTSLTTTTSYMLPARTLLPDCYRQMFYYCSKVDKITCLATSNINTKNSTNNWVKGVKSSGTFTRANASVSWPSGNNGRPSSWTLVNYT